jgi:hypothetical protein
VYDLFGGVVVFVVVDGGCVVDIICFYFECFVEYDWC